MYRSEQIFVQWCKKQEGVKYSKVEATDVPDFIVLYKNKTYLVEAKERMRRETPCRSMLSPGQLLWIENNTCGFVFFCGKNNSGALYQLTDGEFIKKDFLC